MPLTLKSRTPVRFEWADGEVETSITLAPDDDEATLVRKLQRAVGLVVGEPPLPVRPPDGESWGDMVATAGKPYRYAPAARPEAVPPFDPAAAEAALVTAQKPGWEDFNDEDLPEVS